MKKSNPTLKELGDPNNQDWEANFANAPDDLLYLLLERNWPSNTPHIRARNELRRRKKRRETRNFWLPVIISIVALLVSILALFRT